ncbi:MAG: hypothetical protein ACLT16_16665 [[Clostridium] innocuum]
MMSFKQLKKSNRNKNMSSVLQTEFEQKSNVDLSNVHIHYNSSLPKQYMASAIAHNNQIDIASEKNICCVMSYPYSPTEARTRRCHRKARKSLFQYQSCFGKGGRQCRYKA